MSGFYLPPYVAIPLDALLWVSDNLGKTAVVGGALAVAVWRLVRRRRP